MKLFTRNGPWPTVMDTGIGNFEIRASNGFSFDGLLI